MPAANYTYDHFSLMNQRSAGQLWSAGAPATQWAWSPQSSRTSRISWGNPAAWPPPTFEEFHRDGDWVFLLGYGDLNGQWLPQIVTSEKIGRADGSNMTPLPPDPAGRQHYVKWAIPSSGYSLHAVGYMIWNDQRVDFLHSQCWSPPAVRSNAYHGDRLCIRQRELWSDNLNNLGGALVLKQDRDNYLALGSGPGFVIVDRHAVWNADLRYTWNW